MKNILYVAMLLAVCALHAGDVPSESDKRVDLQITHLPYDKTVDINAQGITDPHFYLYRAHPWYPYALKSNDPALWQKVKSACTLCSLSSLPNVKNFGFNLCVINANLEQQKAVSGDLAYPKGDASLSIPLGVNSQHNASLYTYKMSPHFQELESKALNRVVLEPDKIDNACKVCIIDVLPENTQDVCQALKTDSALNGLYKDLKNTLNAGDIKGLGDHPMYRTVTPCVSSCLGSLATPQTGARFMRASLNPEQTYYPMLNLIYNGDTNNPLPFHW